eukprot:2645998-Lingulodinium_polyedra.AAC.1
MSGTPSSSRAGPGKQPMGRRASIATAARSGRTPSTQRARCTAAGCVGYAARTQPTASPGTTGGRSRRRRLCRNRRHRATRVAPRPAGP